MQPWGILSCFLGFLAGCTGSVVEWASTFPLGNLTPWMFWCRIIGVTLLIIGTIILIASRLINSAKEPGTWSDPWIPYKVVTKLTPKPNAPQPSFISKVKRLSTVTFSLACLGLVACLLFFCIGFINRWAETYPGAKISELERVIAGQIGIWGTVFCVTVMVIADCVHAWIVHHIERKRCPIPHNKESRSDSPTISFSVAARSGRPSSFINSYTDAVVDLKDVNPITVPYVDENASDDAMPLQQVRFKNEVQYRQ